MDFQKSEKPILCERFELQRSPVKKSDENFERFVLFVNLICQPWPSAKKKLLIEPPGALLNEPHIGDVLNAKNYEQV